MHSENGHRYAIYYTSAPDSALTRFANTWLRRNPWNGRNLTDHYGSTAWTAAPRRYGWHATLKAPFHLHPDRNKAELVDALAEFAWGTDAFDVSLRLARLGSFLAMVLAEPSESMHCLATECVRRFDHFRKPMTSGEMARRNAANLSERQRELLATWGYPYVFDEFRFHMTLTDSLRGPEAQTAEHALRPLVAKFENGPVSVASIFLFEQLKADAPFVISAEFPLGADR